MHSLRSSLQTENFLSLGCNDLVCFFFFPLAKMCQGERRSVGASVVWSGWVGLYGRPFCPIYTSVTASYFNGIAPLWVSGGVGTAELIMFTPPQCRIRHHRPGEPDVH